MPEHGGLWGRYGMRRGGFGLVSVASSGSIFVFFRSQVGAALAASPWAMGFSPCSAGLVKLSAARAVRIDEIARGARSEIEPMAQRDSGWRLNEIARCSGSILRAIARGTLEPALLCVNASEVRLYGEFKLLHKDFFECRDIILLIENQHGFLVIDGIYTTDRKRAVSMSY